MTVALWLAPRRGTPLYDTLSLLIQSLQLLFPDAPVFEPHITITNELHVDSVHEAMQVLQGAQVAVDVLRKQRNEAIAAHQAASPGNDPKRPHFITFKEFGVGKRYFDKVHLVVAKTPQLVLLARFIREMYVALPQANSARQRADLLEDANVRAQRVALQWALEEFHPHVLVAYLDTYPLDQALLRTLETRLKDALEVGELDHRLLDHQLGWSGGVLKVMRCEGPIAEWSELASIDLH